MRVADGRGARDSIAVTVAVVNVGFEGIAGQYDRDDNGVIDRDEAISAVVDYFNGDITKQDTLAIIQLYLAD